MKYSIVFSSRTGNTEMVANEIKTALPQSDCEYFGAPCQSALEAPLIFLGFWTEKGNCDAATATFMKELENKQIFLFGTAGFGGNQEYFQSILANIQANLPCNNTLIGSFMCQGKMPRSVRERYEKMLLATPNDTKIKEMLVNFDMALAHPSAEDFAAAKESTLAAIENL